MLLVYNLILTYLLFILNKLIHLQPKNLCKFNPKFYMLDLRQIIVSCQQLPLLIFADRNLIWMDDICKSFIGLDSDSSPLRRLTQNKG